MIDSLYSQIEELNTEVRDISGQMNDMERVQIPKMESKIEVLNEELEIKQDKNQELMDELLQKDMLTDKQAIMNKDKHKEIDAMKAQMKQTASDFEKEKAEKLQQIAYLEKVNQEISLQKEQAERSLQDVDLD